MKTRLLTLTIAAILLAFGIYVYNFPPIKISDDLICMDYSNTDMNTLSAGLIHEVVNNYKNKQLARISTPLCTTPSTFKPSPILNDARSVWFDLETLKKFIYHLEINTKKGDNSITSQDLGLRIYFASYPETILLTDPELGDLFDKNYEKHHTVVVIPTKHIGGEEVDFNPLDTDTYLNGIKGSVINDYAQTEEVGEPHDNYNNRNPQPTAALEISNKENIDNNSTQRTGAQNHGNLYPPLGDSGLAF